MQKIGFKHIAGTVFSGFHLHAQPTGWCRPDGSARTEETVQGRGTGSTAALYCQFNGLVPAVQRRCTVMKTILAVSVDYSGVFW